MLDGWIRDFIVATGSVRMKDLGDERTEQQDVVLVF